MFFTMQAVRQEDDSFIPQRTGKATKNLLTAQKQADKVEYGYVLDDHRELVYWNNKYKEVMGGVVCS